MSQTFVPVLQNILRRLPRRHKRQVGFLLFGGAIRSLIEMASVASLSFMAAVISDPTILQSGRLLSLANALGPLPNLEYRWIVLLAAAAALILLALKNVIGAIIVYRNATVCALIDAYFGEILLKKVLDRPYAWLMGKNTSDLFTQISWRRHLGSGILFMTMQLLCEGMVISILLIGILVAAPFVSITTLFGTGVAAAIVFRLFRASSTTVGERLKELESVANRALTMTLRGAKDVKIFGVEEAFQKHFAAFAFQYALCEGKYRLLLRLPSMSFEVLGFSILFATIAVILFTQKDASASSLLGFLTLLTVATWRILNAVNQVLSSLSAIRLDISPARKVLELLGQEETHVVETPVVLPFAREIRLDHVTFSYNETSKAALQDVSLKIEKGMALGVVGRSGGGKSTLVDILIGLLAPGSGTMTVDDRTVDATNAPAWMRQIGYVGQSPYILDATLLGNIAFGVPPKAVDVEWAKECCRLAHVDDFLAELSLGLHSPLGEGGGNLSGGQRQRVAIARALYRRPELLILDEATSALDIKSENALRRTIQELTGRFTLVIIAHRLSAVEDCHALLWLEQGRVRALGPTTEVLMHYNKAMNNTAF